jgi:hypothetical protein
LCNPLNGLWLVDLKSLGTPTTLPTNHPTYQHYGQSTYEQKTKVQLIDFLHRACFSPSISTWTQATKNNFFATWPGLTARAIRKHLPKSLAASKGHLKATPKNLCSTLKLSSTTSLTSPSTVMMIYPSLPEPNVRTQFVYPEVIAITGQFFSNQTGQLPVTLSKGNKYIMVVYNYDSAAILAEPIKNRAERELLRAYLHIHKHLTD